MAGDATPPPAVSFDLCRALQELLAHPHADFVRTVRDHGSTGLLPARLRGTKDAF